MKANPYRIAGPALISFSGGRTSAYMLWHILDAYDGKLPDDVHVGFSNTGKERAETLRFVHDCETHWGVRVRWLEWRTRRTKDDAGNVLPFDARYEEVGFNSASRDGRPFAKLIADKGYTPNAVTRFCTSELKVRVMKWFMQAQGYEHWANIVGLRHDEPKRVAKSRAPNKERWTVALPLDDARVSNRDVMAFWARQPFDLQLEPYEGNCDACFLKSFGKLCRIEREHPGTLGWWSGMERQLDARPEVKCNSNQFVTEYSYAEIIDAVQRQPEFPWAQIDSTENEYDAECGLWCAGEAA